MCSFEHTTIVIGISGVTCGGKTTLANAIEKAFPRQTVACISQDDYYFQEDNPRHTWIKELNHVNFDILSSLDMEQMQQDVLNILESQAKIEQKDINGSEKASSLEDTISRNGFLTDSLQLINVLNKLLLENRLKLLILEGFCLFNYAPITALCDMKFYFTLDKEECEKRRETRVYDPPDCPGYFEKCAWPEHLNHLDEVKKTVKEVRYFTEESNNLFHEVLLSLYERLN